MFPFLINENLQKVAVLETSVVADRLWFQFLKRTFSQFMVFKVTGCHAITGAPLPAPWRLLAFSVIITFTHS